VRKNDGNKGGVGIAAMFLVALFWIALCLTRIASGEVSDRQLLRDLLLGKDKEIGARLFSPEDKDKIVQRLRAAFKVSQEDIAFLMSVRGGDDACSGIRYSWKFCGTYETCLSLS